MKKFFLVLAIALSCVTGARAQNNTTRFFTAYDHETITVGTTAIGFTASKVNTGTGAALAIITVECASGSSCPSRFNLDGTTATSSVGQIIDYQYTLNVYEHQNIVNFSAIRSGSVSAIYQVAYYH